MPRSGSSRSSSPSFSRSSRLSYSSPKTPINIPSYKPSPPVTSSTPVSSSVVHHNHQLERPGFFSNMWSGFGLGAGQSMAMNMFRSDPVVKHVHETPNSKSTSESELNLPKEFIQCMKDNNNDKDLCKQFLE
jgi:hypothetical protein